MPAGTYFCHPMKKQSCLLLFLIAGLLSGFAQTAPTHYGLLRQIPLGGNDSWDYCISDDSLHHLFVSHGNLVQVVDEQTGKMCGAITEVNGVHGIALAADLGKGYISNGKDSSVTVFRLKDFQVIGHIAVTGRNPDAILYDAFTHQVITFNGKSSNATFINAYTDAVTGTLALPGKPDFAVTDEDGNVFVNIENKNLLCVIDPMGKRLEKSYPVGTGESPSGLAIDRNSNRLFIGCDNKLLVVLNPADGKIVATLPIGEGVDAVKFDPDAQRIFASNGDGTLTVISESGPDQYAVLENIKTQPGARTMAVNIQTHHLYLPVAQRGPTPAPTADHPHPRPSIVPDTFIILEYQPK